MSISNLFSLGPGINRFNIFQCIETRGPRKDFWTQTQFYYVYWDFCYRMEVCSVWVTLGTGGRECPE
jgi:hypothetical protein